MDAGTPESTHEARPIFHPPSAAVRLYSNCSLHLFHFLQLLVLKESVGRLQQPSSTLYHPSESRAGGVGYSQIFPTYDKYMLLMSPRSSTFIHSFLDGFCPPATSKQFSFKLKSVDLRNLRGGSMRSGPCLGSPCNRVEILITLWVYREERCCPASLAAMHAAGLRPVIAFLRSPLQILYLSN